MINGLCLDMEHMTNRNHIVQNYSVVSICDVPLAKCMDSLIMTEPRGWLELDKAPVFTKDGRQFAMILSAEGYKHVS